MKAIVLQHFIGNVAYILVFDKNRSFPVEHYSYTTIRLTYVVRMCVCCSEERGNCSACCIIQLQVNILGSLWYIEVVYNYIVTYHITMHALIRKCWVSTLQLCLLHIVPNNRIKQYFDGTAAYGSKNISFPKVQYM